MWMPVDACGCLWVRVDACECPTACSGWDYYSAFAWFTLRSLYDELESRGAEVPLGGIVQSYGGTSIQWWSSPSSILECGAPPGSACCSYGGMDSCLWYTQVRDPGTLRWLVVVVTR